MSYTNPKKPTRANRLITIGRASDVPADTAATLTLEDNSEIALFNCAGSFYALENFCPHRGAQIVDGALDTQRQTVTCALHAWEFSLHTGECLNEQDCQIETYEVTIENANLKIRV